MPSEMKSPGGVSFELVWEKASKDPAKCLPSPPSKPELSIEMIEEKHLAAEERRKSMEAQKIKQGQRKHQQIQEVQAKAAQENEEFKQIAEAKLSTKIHKVEENKQANMQALKSKLKEQEEHGEKVRERKKEISNNGDASPTS